MLGSIYDVVDVESESDIDWDNMFGGFGDDFDNFRVLSLQSGGTGPSAEMTIHFRSFGKQN